MKPNLKRRLAILPVLACSTLALAEPVVLDSATLDRVTAGTQSALERIAVLLSTLPRNVEDLHLSELLPILGADQQASITTFSSEPITFQLLNTGELAASHQLASGDQVVLVRQLSQADASTMSALNPGDSVKTYFLNPGESLRLQQTNSGGTNYLYVYSSKNSSITTLQKNGQ